MSRSAWLIIILVALLFAVFVISNPADLPTSNTPPNQEPISPAVRGIKLAVAQTGIYRMPLSGLDQAGANSSALWNKIALSTGGVQVPVYIDKAANALFFYGLAPDSRYDAVRYYTLEWNSEGGMFMEEAPGGLVQAGDLLTSTLRLEENHLYISRAASQVNEPWFWERLAPGQSVSIDFSLPSLQPGRGRLRIHLWGATRDENVYPDHRVQLNLNGYDLGIVEWDGENAATGVLNAADGWLEKGKNRIEISATGDTGNPIDQSYVDWIEIDYPAPFRLDGNMRAYAAGNRAALEGSAYLFDVTDPLHPLVVLSGRSAGQHETGTPANPYRLAALSSNGGFEPGRIEEMDDIDWSHHPLQTDFILIAPAAFTGRLTPLVEARQQQGLSTVIVPLEEIAGEYGEGSGGPEVINTFLQTAVRNWPPPAPRFLLLVGDASYDFRDYLGAHRENLVPTFLAPVAYGGETVSDSRLADINGDGLPDLAVGRWPAVSQKQVDDLVRRTLAYETGNETSPHSLFVADGTEALFASLSDDLIRFAALDPTAMRLYGFSFDVIEGAWNQGAWLVNYTGHGSLDLWGKTGMLSTSVLDKLHAPGRPPIVVQLTCLTGLFAHPERTSISEDLLLLDRGPVAVIAATSLTLSADQEPFGAALIQALADPSVGTVGEALFKAQHAPGLDSSGGQEVIDTFVLLGDPTLTVVRPQPALN